MSKKEFEKMCFSPNWLEVDLRNSQQEGTQNKEVCLESRRRKDLNTLLKELEQIKNDIEQAVEKQKRLANLIKFYTGEIAQ